MTKRKEKLCSACLGYLDDRTSVATEVNGVKVFLCTLCHGAAQISGQALKERIETIRPIFEYIWSDEFDRHLQESQEPRPKKTGAVPEGFENGVEAMLEDIRQAEEFFKKV